MNDIELEDPLAVASEAETLGLQAISALHALRGPRGIHCDNRKRDLGGRVLDLPRESSSETGGIGTAVSGTTVPVEVTDATESCEFAWSTAVALDAILEAATTAPRWLTPTQRVALINDLLPKLLEQEPSADDPLLPSPADDVQLPLLRTAILVRALSRLAAWRPSDDELKPDSTAKEAGVSSKELERGVRDLRASAKARLGHLGADLVTKVGELDDDTCGAVHAFTAYTVLTALDAVTEHETMETEEPAPENANSAAPPLDLTDVSLTRRRLWQLHRPRVEQLIARHAMGRLDPGSAVELAFYAAFADRIDAEEYARAAAAGAMAGNGVAALGWRQGRVVIQEERDDFAIRALSLPPVELARALAEVAAASLDDRVDSPIDNRAAIVSMLLTVLDTVRASYVNDLAARAAGWPGEHMYGDRLVEAWPTASVLGFAVALHRVVDEVDRRRLLAELDATPSWKEDWPQWLQWDRYIENEPEQGPDILKFIDEKVVQERRGSSGKTDPVVVLLFGPPGTTKTTIARSVSNGLQWPLVSLSPGDFIQGGLEEIEQNSKRIFDRLMRLSRTVVILDECDELFRLRDPQKTSDAVRQVSAFLTASMLPKLQDLHDRSRVVLFICTNFLTSMDPAIKRPGRIDYLIAVAPFDDYQRRRTIEDQMDMDPDRRREMADDVYEAAIDTAVSATSDLIRGELVNLARELGQAPFATVKQANEQARKLAKTAMDPDRRTIKPDDQEFKRFNEDKQVVSEPHRRWAARDTLDEGKA